MVKFLVFLALTTTATAEYVRISRDVGGIVDLGPGYGSGLGLRGLGVSKQINSVGTSIGHNGLGGVGISNHASSVGASVGPVGHEGVGHIGLTNLGHHHGGIESLGPQGGVEGHGHHGAIGPLGHHGAIGPLGHHGGIGGGLGHHNIDTVGIRSPLGGVTRSVSSHHGVGGIGALGGIGHFGGLGGLNTLGGTHGLGSIASINRLSHVSTLPGGYYGGLLAYPTAVGGHVSANQLHLPSAAVDTYKGYYGGYYPGSIGYGHSYRFFH